MNKDNYILDKRSQEYVERLKGPVFIFGAGGFIGINLLRSILQYRSDVYGVSMDHKNNWRFMATKTPHENLISCNINDINQVRDLINKYKPRTVFNLAAYGAYSRQKEYKLIYGTNFNANIDLMEVLKEHRFAAYINAGSSSEYGYNSAGPAEDKELMPNSHYAVSKVATYYALKYYGKVENLPVINLRLYSAFGPWEEPDRLIPVLISGARKGYYPSLVSPEISRDFIYIKDVVRAFIYAAINISRDKYGNVYNVATGIKTSIKELAEITGEILDVKSSPEFGSLKNRPWDLNDWYGNFENLKNDMGWEPLISLRDGLKKVVAWQNEVDFDNAFWN